MVDKGTEFYKHDLSRTRPRWVKVMAAQLRTKFEDWVEQDGLYSPGNIPKFRSCIELALNKAKELDVGLLVFPELSVPGECVEMIRMWSEDSKAIVVGGSHYTIVNDELVSRSPVVFEGEVYYTQKIKPAPQERSVISQHGLNEGKYISLFQNTPVGNFAVLICSDNLNELGPKDMVKNEELDFWIIPALQNDSKWHYKRMTADVEGPSTSRYIIYCNNEIPRHADGKSAFFGMTHRTYIEELKNRGYTDNAPEWKLLSLQDSEDFYAVEVDIHNKRSFAPPLPGDEPNIRIIGTGSLSSSAHHIPTNPQSVVENIICSNDEYKILLTSDYETLRAKFAELEKPDSEFQPVAYSRSIEKISSSLKEKGIVFLAGPIRVGKTHLLRFLKTKLESKAVLVANIEGTDLITKRDEIISTALLYYHWVQEIAEHIARKLGTSLRSYALPIRTKIGDKNRFTPWFESNKPLPGGNDLEAFLRTVAELRMLLKLTDDLILTFHIDDVHNYTNESVFHDLCKDILGLPDRTYDTNNSTVKLVVASRYLPVASFRKRTVNLIPHFDLEIVTRLTDILADEMSEPIRVRFAGLILRRTDGYPWFVMRFFRLYLKKRTDPAEKLNPLELAVDIFDNGRYWTNDSFLESDNESDFLEQLNLLIQSSSSKRKNDFRRFISSGSLPTNLNNGRNSPDDFLIRQSGFFKFNEESGLFDNNGCFLLQHHFKPIIEVSLK